MSMHIMQMTSGRRTEPGLANIGGLVP